MSPEWAAVIIAAFGLGGTAVNVFLSARIKADLLGMKLWTRENFVAKNDMTTYLSPIKESITILDSTNRLRRSNHP